MLAIKCFLVNRTEHKKFISTWFQFRSLQLWTLCYDATGLHALLNCLCVSPWFLNVIYLTLTRRSEIN